MSEVVAENRWSSRGLLIGGFAVVIVALGGFGVWAAESEISGAIISPGQVEVERNRQVVQHSVGGVVAEIEIKEGDTVTAGDILVRLDPRDQQSELIVVEGQLFEVLARSARLEAERDGTDSLVFDPLLADSDNPIAADLMEGQERLFRARLESAETETQQLSRQQDQIKDQIIGIRAQQESIETQLGLIEQELADQQILLGRGLAQSSRILGLQREQASLIGQQGELAAQVAQAEGRITEIDVAVLRIGTARREEALSTLRDLQFNEIELSEKRRQLISELDRLEIRAPVSGVVYDLKIFGTGVVIRPADPLMYIVPQDRPLIITVQVDPRHIDEMRVDQEVRVRLPAFNQRTTPELLGKVLQISADAFTDATSRSSFYRAQISLNPGEIDRLPDGLRLIPGMPVEAFTATDARTPLQYLLKPLTDSFARTFREN